MDPAIRQALLWTIVGVGVIMTGFTALDVGSGASTTALWIGVVAWPLVTVIAGWILKKNPYRGKGTKPTPKEH